MNREPQTTVTEVEPLEGAHACALERVRPATTRRIVPAVGVGVALGVLLASASALAASDRHCPEEEYIAMDDPHVSVVEGPGDAATEQASWEAREVYYLGELYLDPGNATLERVVQQ